MENTIDKFSWRRVGMVARYMLPTLKKQLILYPLVVTLFTVTGQMFCHLGKMDATEAGVLSTLCGFMFYFAPASLARKDNRFVTAQLPVRVSEKFMFLLIYYWIVIGALTIGLNKVLSMLMIHYFPSENMEIEEILTYFSGLMGTKLYYVMVTGWLACIALQIFALYGVVHARSNRIITAIGYSLGAYIGMCVSSGLLGAIFTFFNIWNWQTRFETATDNLTQEEFAGQLISEVMPVVLTAVTVIMCVMAVVLLFKSYKIIRHRGF